MTLDGGPPPEGGYPDPGKYTPDNLGEKSVWESDGRLCVILSPSALQYLDAEEGDLIRFKEGGIEENKVVATKVDDSEE